MKNKSDDYVLGYYAALRTLSDNHNSRVLPAAVAVVGEMDKTLKELAHAVHDRGLHGLVAGEPKTVKDLLGMKNKK